MKDHTQASLDAHVTEGNHIPPSTGFTANVLSEAITHTSVKSLQTGVSTHYAPTSGHILTNKTVPPIQKRKDTAPHWYVLRSTYGREKLAYEYIINHGGEAFYPTILVTKEIDGKRKTFEESRIPNIFFARGTEQEIQHFVYDNVNLPYLRFYYKHTHNVPNNREPLIVPDNQMDTLRIICQAEADQHTLLIAEEIRKFRKGDHVRIINGEFQGVTGIVARFKGQQRVGIVIDGLLTAITAYIPSAFLQKQEKTETHPDK